MSSGKTRQEAASLQENHQVDEAYLLIKKQIFITKAGKPFGVLRLGDTSGELEAKVWDGAEELLAPLTPGQAVRVAGKVQLYNGQAQLVVTAVHGEPNLNPAQFLPKSPCDPGQLWEILAKLKQSVKDAGLQRLLRAFFGEPELRRAFDSAPAAKAAHHAYVHGLLEHTVSVAGLARLVADHYPHLDADIFITGALLHDIGKIEELTLGPPIDYTDAGRLEGHLVLGARMLDARLAKLKGLPTRVGDHLRHMILSHHGSEEFGSPVKPKTAEALALNAVDDLDAKTWMVKRAMEQGSAGEGNWSNFNRLLERHVYTGPSPWQGPVSGTGPAFPGHPGLGEPASENAAVPPTLSLFDLGAKGGQG